MQCLKLSKFPGNGNSSMSMKAITVESWGNAVSKVTGYEQDNWGSMATSLLYK